ncbi:hypothetical protein AJ79_02142 [Helicocarpus griseus UAMH5409]|uniref:WHIM1 domain-containing protein n=1 Tax=Helicocarpus griseus UAMH5409 TaxID=1447875 RepID=A0A2B7Y4K0_9EURO|nr:hypothetical protein AJ79_02142 [Helicocarpus griseus UAMH5409]
MSDSDSSSLSSAPSTDDEVVAARVNRSIGLEKYFKPVKKPAKPASPPPPKRAPSPPHEYVLADNPDIAFIVMFRSRFSDVFPKSLPHYGPQDIERGVTDTVPGDHIERLLCALIGLCLNRKKDVERGHYQRALEEVVQTHASQWPRSWGGKNPLHGGGSFTTMTPTERLAFLKALILWALSSSDAVQAKLKESYKQARHDDDLNQPLSVQPWGNDAYKRRYWLIEGRDDTHFRLYRESNPALKTRTWWSVAGTIPELKSVADSLAEEKSQNSKRLSEKIYSSIPRFEGSEEKRKRRDYRQARKAAFARPEPGFSLYEGRTRGKKLKYTYSDDEEDFSSDALPTRKSARHSRLSTPGEPAGPTFTASGRQVRSRVGGSYGESMLSGQRKETSQSVGPGGEGEEGEQPVSNGRPQRARVSRQANGTGNHISGYNEVDEMDEESDAASSGNEWEGGDEDNDYGDEDEDEEMSDDSGLDDGHQSLVVQLRYGKGKQPLSSSPQPQNAPPEEASGGRPIQPAPGPQATNGLPSAGQVPVEKGPDPYVQSEKQAPPESAIPATEPPLADSKVAPQAPAPAPSTAKGEEPPVVPMETDTPEHKQQQTDPQVSGAEQNGMA